MITIEELKQSQILLGKKVISMEEKVEALIKRIDKLESKIGTPSITESEYLSEVSMSEKIKHLTLLSNIPEWEDSFISSIRYLSPNRLSQNQKLTITSIFNRHKPKVSI